MSSALTQIPNRLLKPSSRKSLETLQSSLCRQTSPSAFPKATSIRHNVPIYAGCEIVKELNSPLDHSTAYAESLMDEWNCCLGDGPGAFVIKGMVSPSLIDETNKVFDSILAREKSLHGNPGKKGDHFATAGVNDRIWNSFQKLAIAKPTTFVHYFANPLLDLVCESWLGPGYQITSQLNVVRPGGEAQTPHRDYHLGFQSRENVMKYPKAMQVACQLLTLQGAIAHTDMPLPTGPTLLLPFSQTLESGYIAVHDPAFQKEAQKNFVQLPLRKGDALFFSPALVHAAGSNLTENQSRSANLLQISSAFGKPMEAIDNFNVVRQTFESLRQLQQEVEGWLGKAKVQALIRAIASGYAFPTNLDVTSPRADGSMATTEQDLLWLGLKEGWTVEKVDVEMRELRRGMLP